MRKLLKEFCKSQIIIAITKVNSERSFKKFMEFTVASTLTLIGGNSISYSVVTREQSKDQDVF